MSDRQRDSRWATDRVIVLDLGTHVVMGPVSDDRDENIRAVRGLYRYPEGPSTDELRRQAREEEVEIQDRKGAPVILGAYALVAELRDEPAAEIVSGLLRDPGLHCRTISTAAAEAVDRVSRLGGHPAPEVALSLLRLGVEITPVDEDLAILAGVLRAEAYHRTRSPLSLADCIVAAETMRCRGVLVTSDPALLDLVSSRGGSFVALPASDGSVHTPEVLHTGAPLA